MKRWIHASESIVESNTIVDNGKVQPGLLYHRDGFTHEVIWVSKDHRTCKEKETWINEDTGKPMQKITKCKIAQDEDGQEFYYDPEYEAYAFNPNDPEGYSWWARTYATGADNYPYDWGDLEDPYTEASPEASYDEESAPSATNRDYGPSNPWDAPGMSVRDFI